MAKRLKLKVRKFWGLVRTFVEVTGEKLVGEGGSFLPPPPPILNRVKKRCSENKQQIYRRTPMPKCDFNEVAKQLFATFPS